MCWKQADMMPGKDDESLSSGPSTKFSKKVGFWGVFPSDNGGRGFPDQHLPNVRTNFVQIFYHLCQIVYFSLNDYVKIIEP